MKTFTKILFIFLVFFVLASGINSLYARENVKTDVNEKTACCKANAPEKAAPYQAHAEKTACCKTGCKCVYKTVYICLEEGCTFKSDKEGKCPKCGKELVKKVFCCMTAYICPDKTCKYHSDKPGKCKCGKELVKKEICKEVKTVYACPVEGCAYTSDKPGKCPKCGKELVKKETCSQEQHEAYYVCPMKECSYKSDKPGKCPKCGKELKKVVPQAECSKICATPCDHAKKEKKD